MQTTCFISVSKTLLYLQINEILFSYNMTLKIYEYSGCGTCRRALKYLDSKNIQYKKVPIREKPPTKTELNKMLKAYDGNMKRLLNTSGTYYRELNMKDKIKELTSAQIITILSENGNLIKRPFVLSKIGAVVGFKENEWETFISRL